MNRLGHVFLVLARVMTPSGGGMTGGEDWLTRSGETEPKSLETTGGAAALFETVATVLSAAAEVVGVGWEIVKGVGEILGISIDEALHMDDHVVSGSWAVASWEELARNKDKSYLDMWTFTILGSDWGYETRWVMVGGVECMTNVANEILDSSKTTSL